MSITDKELADKVVALGVGYPPDTPDGCWTIEAETAIAHGWQYMDTDQFVRDWRVAGALMEKIPLAAGENPLLIVLARAIISGIEPLSRAIIEACVEALTVSDS